jgi:septal ring factor EnvC (AmiA/AmiB activator)
MESSQLRERITRWIEDSKELFTLLPELLETDQKLNAKTEHAEKEADKLRKELAELRKELAEAKTQGVDFRKASGDLHKELDELRKQNEQLRAEKDEAGQALAKVLETVQATNQIAQKLGVTKSPFARRAEAQAQAPAPAAAPNPAPHE